MKYAALRKALETSPCPADFWGNQTPRCPHCGEECNVSANDWWFIYEEGEHEVSCPHCDEDFTVSTRASFCFSTCAQHDCEATT